MKALFLVLLLLVPATVAAQEPVVKWADWVSYGTAAVNPAMATYEAFKSETPKCRLGRLALAEGIGNGVALTIKHFVRSERPCLGCAPDGMPSSHTMNSFIGIDAPGPASGWGVRMGIGIAMGGTTAGLRVVGNRHTPTQVLVGALLGIGAEAASRALVPCGETRR